jgi:heterodisulfide reductase subunit B
MRVGLFVPCYVDAFHPEVGIATLELLERFGLDVEYPCDQTCCGQPMTNTGCHAESAATEALFVRNFALTTMSWRRRGVAHTKFASTWTRSSRPTRSGGSGQGPLSS